MKGVDIEGRSAWGCTPLVQSAIGNQIHTSAILLDCGADIDTIYNDRDSVLYSAIHFCFDDIPQLLFRRGATYTQIDKIGNSILHPLATSGGLRSLDIILTAQLRGIDTEAINKNGKTALQIAQERVDKPDGFVEKFKELLTDIRVRNAELERTGGGNNSIRETNWRLRLFKLVRLA